MDLGYSVGNGGPNQVGKMLGYAEVDKDFKPYNIDFFLYTRSNNSKHGVRMKRKHPLHCGFNPHKKTVVLVHGTSGSSEMPAMLDLKDSILKAHNLNVIMFEWGHYARSFKGVMKHYKAVGRALGDFLTQLHNSTGHDFDKIHIIGHSVGVHVSAFAGRSTPQKVHRLTGLDPSFLRHVMRNRSDFILPTDATHVDCIRTSTYLGLRDPVCQCDFYANEGLTQIGCATGMCDHFAATTYYLNTVKNPRRYPAHKCNAVTAKTVDGCAENYTAYAGHLGATPCTPGIYRFKAVITRKESAAILAGTKVTQKQYIKNSAFKPKKDAEPGEPNKEPEKTADEILTAKTMSNPISSALLKTIKEPVGALLGIRRTKNTKYGTRMRKWRPLRSGFNPMKKTIVLVAGTSGSVKSQNLITIKNALLKKHNVNVIIADWSTYSQRPMKVIVRYYKAVGHTLADFLVNLHNRTGLEYDKIQIIGHSVGAQIAAIAARSMPKKIHRLTGLDPSAIRHILVNRADYILPSDAQYVDCIHTGNTLGIRDPVCQFDYYANDGVSQPGCMTDSALFGVTTTILHLAKAYLKRVHALDTWSGDYLCDHFAACSYYSNSVLRPKLYPSYQCETLLSDQIKDCSVGNYTAYAGYLGYLARDSGNYQFKAKLTKENTKSIFLSVVQWDKFFGIQNFQKMVLANDTLNLLKNETEMYGILMKKKEEHKPHGNLSSLADMQLLPTVE